MDRNSLLAIVLSVVVLMAWELLYMQPQREIARKAAEALAGDPERFASICQRFMKMESKLDPPLVDDRRRFRDERRHHGAPAGSGLSRR